MKIENVVIVAGGKNTRFQELSIFPKVLLPTNEYPSILYNDCKVFKDKNLFLVINQDYFDMVQNYVKVNKLNITLIKSSNSNGSANTLAAIKKQLPKKYTMLIWSDLIISKENFKEIEDCFHYNMSKAYEDAEDQICYDHIVVTRQGDYRFKIENARVKNVNLAVEKGNVPGIYIYKNLDDFTYKKDSKDDYDYIEFLRDLNEALGVIELKSPILELKDLEVYEHYYLNPENKAEKNVTRFFNKITFIEDKVEKRCINPDFNHLIDREIEWYDYAKSLGVSCIPKIYDSSKEEHWILMQNLKGYISLYEFLYNETDQNKIKNVLEKCLEETKKMHETKVVDPMSRNITEDIADDFEIEFYNKVLKRCNDVKDIIVNYNEKELKKTLNKAIDLLFKSLSKSSYSYCFCHGDLNGSNILYNPETDDIKFIDPRGYFGETKDLGYADYDFAKIKYFLSGYDDFNNNHYIYSRKHYKKPKQLDYIPKELQDPKYDLIVGIIWIALTSYIAQDVFKVNISYEYGLEYLNIAIETYKKNFN